jgi:CHASE3 domain sensor protein
MSGSSLPSNAASLSPDSSGDPATATPDDELVEALSKAVDELDDALNRVEMARSDARGENFSLDSVDASIQGMKATMEEVRRARATRIAAAVAQSLEKTAQRLRSATSE